jgi:hypothetical protein
LGEVFYYNHEITRISTDLFISFWQKNEEKEKYLYIAKEIRIGQGMREIIFIAVVSSNLRYLHHVNLLRFYGIHAKGAL